MNRYSISFYFSSSFENLRRGEIMFLFLLLSRKIQFLLLLISIYLARKVFDFCIHFFLHFIATNLFFLKKILVKNLFYNFIATALFLSRCLLCNFIIIFHIHIYKCARYVEIQCYQRRR